MLGRHAGWRFRLLVITADYCVNGDSHSETSIHLDVCCRRAFDYCYSVSDLLDIWTSICLESSWRWFFQIHALEFGRVRCRGSQVSRSSTFNIITPATSRMFAVLTCPYGREKAERRVTSQSASEKNPVAGLYVSSLELVAGGLSVSGGVCP